MPFVIDNTQVGWIRPDASKHLLKYKDVFELSKSSSIPGIHIFSGKTAERNKKVAEVLEDLRAKDVLSALRGWRDEVTEFSICSKIVSNIILESHCPVYR